MNADQRFAAAPDRPFLWELHGATMRDAIERTWGWDERWQRADFDRRFNESAVTMLDLDGTAAGCLWLESPRPGAIYVSDSQVLPRFQRKAHFEQWQALLFRDHLRADADAARDYEALRRLAEDYPDDRVAYTKATTGFVTRII